MIVDRHRSRSLAIPAGDPSDPASRGSAIGRRTSPQQPIDAYDASYTITDVSSFGRPGRILPPLMLSIFPALALLYVAAKLPWHWLYLAAIGLNILIMSAATVLIIVSALLGWVHYRRRSRVRTHGGQRSRY